MPMFNWLNIYEDNDLSNLSRNGVTCRRVTKVYNLLLDQLITRFGVSEDYMKILRNRMRIEILWGDVISKGDRTKIMMIEVLEIQNNELKNKFEKLDLFESLLHFEQQGIQRREREVTVTEFYKISELMDKQHKAKVAAHKKAMSNGRKKG